LNAGNYLGLDSEKRLIDLGIKNEVGRGLIRSKSPEFVVSSNFEFEKFSKRPDFSIAQSLFTHLDESDVRLCLKKLRAVIKPGGRLYSTWFIVDESHVNQAERSHSHRSFRYPCETIKALGLQTGWRPRYIGDWGHPRNQQMVEFVADTDGSSSIR
jgi:hypothetical protein